MSNQIDKKPALLKRSEYKKKTTKSEPETKIEHILCIVIFVHACAYSHILLFYNASHAEVHTAPKYNLNIPIKNKSFRFKVFEV